MKILVFAPQSYQDTPIDQWLSDLDAEYFLLAPNRTRKSYQHLKNLRPFPRYWSNQNVELTGLELTREHRFDAVIAMDEWDILRSARLREAAQIQGQSINSATAFRDKMRMKTLLRAQGVPVADFAEFKHAFDALYFTMKHGFPVVVKPIAGVAGANTRILRDENELREYLTQGVPPEMMIEAFVSGCLHHVDGLCDENGVLFGYSSRYINSCLSYQDGKYSGSVSLETEDELNQRLLGFTGEILKALPKVEGSSVHAFHAEVFVTPEGKLVCCEIACRPGGGRIVEQTQLEYGIHLNREFVRGQMGLPCDIRQSLADARRAPKRFGHMFIPHSGRGTVTRLPELGHFPWAHAEKAFVKVGEVLELEEGRRQNLASCLIEGDSEAAVLSRMREWNEWFLANTEIVNETLQ